MYPKVVVILIYYNRVELTIPSISSLLRLNYPNYSILLIDNGSTEQTSKIVQQTFPNLKQIKIEVNKGLDSAANVGLKAALEDNPKYILPLTNDIWADPQLLQELVTVAEGDPKIGIIGVINYFLNRPGVVAWGGAYITNWWFGIRKDPFINGKNKLPDRPFEVDYSPGFMIRSDVIHNIGYFCGELFMYFEEADYSLRAKRAGYKVVAVPKAKLFHEVSDKIYGRVNNYFMIRNEPRFFLRNARIIYWPTFLISYFSRTVFWILKSFLKGVIKGQWLDFMIYSFGLRDFLLGRYGEGSLKKLQAICNRYEQRSLKKG